MNLKEYIGAEFKKEAIEQGISIKQLSESLCTTDKNIFHIFKGSGMDINRVMDLSLLLNRDFFAELSNEYKKRKGITNED